MPLRALRAKQSTATTGTGTLTLAAAPPGARSFRDAFGNASARVRYVISGGTFFEIGLGTFDGQSPGTLTRDATPLASSNAGALVSLPAGVADVFAWIEPADRNVIESSATSVTIGLADLGNLLVWSGASAGTLNLPAIATVPIGGSLLVRNAGTAALTIDPAAAETVNGASTLALAAGAEAELFRTSAGWAALGNALPLAGGNVTGDLRLGTSAVGGRLRIAGAGQLNAPTLGSANNAPIVFSNVDASYGLVGGVATDGRVWLQSQRMDGGASTYDITLNEAGGSVGVGMLPPASARLAVNGNLFFNSGYGSVALAFGIRAWVNFDGTGTPAVRGAGNVSSIADNGAGDYTANFAIAMPDANYVVGGTAQRSATNDGGNAVSLKQGVTAVTASSVRIATFYAGPGNEDCPQVHVIIVR